MRPKRFWNADRDELLRTMFAALASVHDMNLAFGGEISIAGIYARIRELGLRKRPEADADTRWHEPCPYWVIREGKATPCGCMVNRRANAGEAKPTPYCEDHREKVLPRGRGPLGFIGGRSGNYTSHVAGRIG